jgi:hypothetical protein
MNEGPTASSRIIDEVNTWPGVQTEPGSLGEIAVKLGKKEIGHLHGDTAAHFEFDKALWTELKAAGRIVDHPVFPGRAGPAARRIGSEDDIRDVIALLRLNYDRRSAGNRAKDK